MLRDVAVHHPHANIVLRDADPPRAPARRRRRFALLRVPVQDARVPSGGHKVALVFTLLLNGLCVVGTVAGAQVVDVLAVDVHRVEVEAARGAAVVLPDNVEDLTGEGGEGAAHGVEALVGEGAGVVGREVAVLVAVEGDEVRLVAGRGLDVLLPRLVVLTVICVSKMFLMTFADSFEEDWKKKKKKKREKKREKRTPR